MTEAFFIPTGTPISELPTGTIDSRTALFPISIGVPSSPQTIRSDAQQVSEFFNMGYTISAAISGSALNITILGLNGSTPSASNPVRFIIGNSFYYLTSPTNYMAANGTNWHNAAETVSGSYSTLAGNDIDYFMFAIAESGASAGLKFGHSRIPYAETMADFVNTTTSEKYIKGNWTNFNATDKVVNIGRFRATLSSAFVWSIPTPKVINRPIFETDWLSYKPFPSVGTGVSLFGTCAGLYQVRGAGFNADMNLPITTTLTGNNGVKCTLPFTGAAGYNISTGRENSVVGTMLQGQPSGNIFTWLTYNNGHPGGTGYTVMGSVRDMRLA